VIDVLCKHAMRENAAAACFRFDFPAREESPAAILDSALQQVVSRLNEGLERIDKAFRDGRNVIGRRGLVLSEISEFLQDISFSRCIFICIEALYE